MSRKVTAYAQPYLLLSLVAADYIPLIGKMTTGHLVLTYLDHGTHRPWLVAQSGGL